MRNNNNSPHLEFRPPVSRFPLKDRDKDGLSLRQVEDSRLVVRTNRSVVLRANGMVR